MAMTTYDDFKRLDADLKIHKALHFHWTPTLEHEGETDLETLWDELTDDERADLTQWLKEQGRI